MILTENDLVCFMNDKDFITDGQPSDYLLLKENIVSRGFFYYSVDNKIITIISSIEDVKKETDGILPFFSNLIMSQPLYLVDTIHGVLKDCYVDHMEFVSRFDEAPEVHIITKATNLEPWTTELNIDCYNTDPKYQGIMNGKSIKALGKDSIVLKGAYILQDWNNIAENISNNTISLSIKVNRNGIVDIKQMFYFSGRIMGDPGDYNIINNLMGRIIFGRNLDRNRPDKNSESSVDIKIGPIKFYVKDIKIDSLNYVFDIIDLPTDFEVEDAVIYRLYYHGRLVAN